MITELAQAIARDYLPKIVTISHEIEEHNKQLYALGVQSGDAWNDMMEAVTLFKDRQVDVVTEMFVIFKDVLDAFADVEKGTPIRDDTGLPRSIGDPRRRQLVRKYFDELRAAPELPLGPKP